MPYPNEHSARLKDPKGFNPDTYRRTSGGTIYGKIKVPKTIAIIWGKLKGKAKPSDPVIPQALRFPTKNWTAQKAKKWLKDNKVKYISFESAKAKEKDQKSVRRFDESTRPEEVPQDAFNFDTAGLISFFEEDDEKNNVRLTLYDGSVVKHWYWGNMAFDLKGMKLARRRIPILYTHDRDQRLGYSTKATFDGKFVLEGKLLKRSAKASEIRADSQDGFPFEASLRFDPTKVVLRYVREGETVKVNGNDLKGPGTVLLKTLVMEGSICVFGLQNNCKTEIFETSDNDILSERVNVMAEENATIESAEMFAADYPELHAEIVMAAKAEGKAEGEKSVRELFGKFAEKFGDDPALCVEQFKANSTIEAAMAAQNEKLRAKNKVLAEKANKQSQASVDPANAEFSDQQIEGNETPDETKPAKERYTDEFKKSADIQAEFKDNLEAYIAFRENEDAGRVKITGR